MEDPGYPGASQAFQSARASVIPIPVDGDGIDCRKGDKVISRRPCGVCNTS